MRTTLKATPLRVFSLDPGRAARSMSIAATYDELRLTTYASRPDVAARIETRRADHARGLRFDDVGYFNRIYDWGSGAGAEELLEMFSGGSVHPAFYLGLVGEPPGSTGSWCRGEAYSWLEAPLAHCRPVTTATPIRTPEPGEHEAFLQTYLRAFGANVHSFPVAIRNMRLLFDVPQLHFLMATSPEGILSIGMLFKHGDTAMLSAGSTLEAYRGRGCHMALIGARLHLARRLGCRRIASWAVADSESESNMRRQGLELVARTASWKLKRLSR